VVLQGLRFEIWDLFVSCILRFKIPAELKCFSCLKRYLPANSTIRAAGPRAPAGHYARSTVTVSPEPTFESSISSPSILPTTFTGL